MRIPTVLMNCKVVSAVAVVAMVAGTILDQQWARSWSILLAVYAVGLCLQVAVANAAEAIKLHLQKWSHQAFEDGWRSGVEQGREMEAAERFIAASREQS